MNAAPHPLLAAIAHRWVVVPETKAAKGEHRVYEVPCNRGGTFGDRKKAHIFAHGAALYGYTGIGTRLLSKLVGLGATKWQAGDEEFSVIFPPSLLSKVAGVVKPVRVRTALKSAASRTQEPRSAV